ncbi:MAG: hypothetical protein ACPGWR_10230 [Ardenticatenaceae bacterium]
MTTTTEKSTFATRFARGVLTILGFINLARGGFHWLAPDSGAGSVAGMNLEYDNADDVIFLLGAAGLMQLTFGVWYLYIVQKKPAMIPLALASEGGRNVLLVLTEYTFKRPAKPVPGRFMHMAVCVLSIIALMAAKSDQSENL